MAFGVSSLQESWFKCKKQKGKKDVNVHLRAQLEGGNINSENISVKYKGAVIANLTSDTTGLVETKVANKIVLTDVGNGAMDQLILEQVSDGSQTPVQIDLNHDKLPSIPKGVKLGAINKAKRKAKKEQDRHNDEKDALDRLKIRQKSEATTLKALRINNKKYLEMLDKQKSKERLENNKPVLKGQIDALQDEVDNQVAKRWQWKKRWTNRNRSKQLDKLKKQQDKENDTIVDLGTQIIDLKDEAKNLKIVQNQIKKVKALTDKVNRKTTELADIKTKVDDLKQESDDLENDNKEAKRLADILKDLKSK